MAGRHDDRLSILLFVQSGCKAQQQPFLLVWCGGNPTPIFIGITRFETLKKEYSTLLVHRHKTKTPNNQTIKRGLEYPRPIHNRAKKG